MLLSTFNDLGSTHLNGHGRVACPGGVKCRSLSAFDDSMPTLWIVAHILAVRTEIGRSVDSRGQKVEAGAMPRPFAPHELVLPEMLHLPQQDGSIVSVKQGPITSTLIEVCDAAVRRPPGYDAVGQLSRVEMCYSNALEVLLADPTIEIRPMSGTTPVAEKQPNFKNMTLSEWQHTLKPLES